MKAPDEETVLEWIRLAGGAVIDSTHRLDVVSWRLAGAVHVRFWPGTGTLLVQGPEPNRTHFRDALKSIADVAPTSEPQKLSTPEPQKPKVIQLQLRENGCLVILRDDGKVFVNVPNDKGYVSANGWKEVPLP